jgi:hypothetical protein
MIEGDCAAKGPGLRRKRCTCDWVRGSFVALPLPLPARRFATKRPPQLLKKGSNNLNGGLGNDAARSRAPTFISKKEFLKTATSSRQPRTHSVLCNLLQFLGAQLFSEIRF